jgi:hypothetical protein
VSVTVLFSAPGPRLSTLLKTRHYSNPLGRYFTRAFVFFALPFHGACDGSRRNKGSAADTTIALATTRNLQPVREEVQCRVYIRQPPVKVARP